MQLEMSFWQASSTMFVNFLFQPRVAAESNIEPLYHIVAEDREAVKDWEGLLGHWWVADTS